MSLSDTVHRFSGSTEYYGHVRRSLCLIYIFRKRINIKTVFCVCTVRLCARVDRVYLLVNVRRTLFTEYVVSFSCIVLSYSHTCATFVCTRTVYIYGCCVLSSMLEWITRNVEKISIENKCWSAQHEVQCMHFVCSLFGPFSVGSRYVIYTATGTTHSIRM